MRDKLPARELLELLAAAESKRVNSLFGIVGAAAFFILVEIGRRLGELNNENARIGDVLSKSVTAEKFDDYSDSERVARELALAAQSEKISDHGTRLERAETATGTNATRSNRSTLWIIALIGFVLTIVGFFVSVAIALLVLYSNGKFG